MSTEFSLSPISCLELDKLGVYIAIGYTNGSVAVIKLLTSKQTIATQQQQQGCLSFTSPLNSSSNGGVETIRTPFSLEDNIVLNNSSNITNNSSRYNKKKDNRI